MQPEKSRQKRLLARLVGRRVRRLLRDRRGGMLVEALVAVGLLAGVLTLALQGLATGSRAMGICTTATGICMASLARSAITPVTLLSRE